MSIESLDDADRESRHHEPHEIEILPSAADDELSDGASTLSDQDNAQAVLQPAMSTAASHFTSFHTPATEKAAAIQHGAQHAGYFDIPASPPEGDHTDDSESTPNATSPAQNKEERLEPPSPWRPGVKDNRSRQTRSMLGVAFGPTRNRSSSAGQEALKRLQKAFPSFSGSSNFLPSLPASLRFNDSKATQNSPPTGSRQSPSSATPTGNQTPTPGSRKDSAHSRSQSSIPSSTTLNPGLLPSTPRPRALRRVTSDDSLLYHSLSRTSSLGDDDRFHNIHDMVNIRLIALKDSLPDVPTFKMPSLPKFQNVARRSQLSLNGFFTNEPIMEQQSREIPKEEILEKPKDNSSTLDDVLQDLTGDVVILGGYRGSILRSAEPPHHQLWAPVKLGLNMRKANLEVGFDDADEESMPERIIPSGMLKNIGPIDISRKLFKKLRSCENARTGRLRVWDFGYDWRLSPHRLSRTLQQFLSSLPCNQDSTPSSSRGAIVIAHSLGGLITRHAVNQRPDLFAGVLYAGVPQSCINILGPLRNGDPVLFNEKLLTARVNFSIRTSFLLLPDDGFCFIDSESGEEYPIDFFDAQDWQKHRLSPCVAPTLPDIASKHQNSSSFTSLLPNTFLRARSDSKSDKKTPEVPMSPDLSTTQAEYAENMEYLDRTLKMIKQFRSELRHKPSHEAKNAYPPVALIYGKDIPTVYAARVNGRDGIPCADAYDDLVFRSGDGVVLAKEAMLPDGYAIVKGGRVSSERGHITLLGDMPALGRALEALVRGRKKGIGMGVNA